MTGKGIYADDLYVEGMLHAKALRSQYPHALLKKVDVSQAQSAARRGRRPDRR